MSRGRIVHWMLEEVGAPYEVKLVDFQKREHKSPAYLAVNPMGKLPAIVHRGTVVTETPAICAYLADAFPEAKLAPATTDPRRGTYLRWLFFGAACVEPAMTDKMLERPAASRASTVGYGTFDDTMHSLEVALSPGPYILGDAFSAADVYVGALVRWAIATKIIEAPPAFQTYFARCAERPAFVRCEEQCAALAAELKRG
jgi:glutathione S-transferase